MIEQLQENIGGALGGAISVIIGAAVWFKRMKPVFAKDDLSVAAAEADLRVIERLEKECDRLSTQNAMLAQSVNSLQLEVMKMRDEHSKLHLELVGQREENSELRKENAEMRKENSELMAEMVELKGDLKEMSAIIQELTKKK